MTLSELLLMLVLIGPTAFTAFVVIVVRPARMPFLVALTLCHFGTVALITICLVLVAGGMALFYGIGIALFGLVGTALGGWAGELVRTWQRRSRKGETITFRGSQEQFAMFERFYAELATRKAEMDSLQELTDGREAEAANPRWADLVGGATLSRFGHERGGSFESLLAMVFAGRYALGEVSFHRGLGELTYLPARRALAGEVLPLKMLVEMFGLEVVGDSREEGDEPSVIGGAIFGGAGRRA